MRILFFILSFFSFSVFGQDTILTPPLLDSITEIELEIRPTKCYFPVIESEAEFPGGLEALYKYLGDSINFSTSSFSSEEVLGAEKIIARFTIDTTGSIQNIQIIRGSIIAFNQIVIDAIEKMPNWTPYKDHSGNPIESSFTLTIRINFD
ncbi:MAG: protein TonB [Parvicella sp.]|jgi:protein TonB